MQKILKDFKPLGGKHCITNALRQVFEYRGYSISEEMLLGIGEGLSFTYINLSNAPMIVGRAKPSLFEEKIGDRLNIKIKCKSTKQYDKAHEKAKKMIENDEPVFIYVDMPYLNYLNLDEASHFGGHAVVLFGYDDNHFYISDRDNSDHPIRTPKGDIAEDFHRVSYEEVAKARSSHYKPFPANNKWIETDFSSCKSIDKAIVVQAVRNNCEAMLNPPANLLGINGIHKFSKEVLKWGKFEEEKLKLTGITNYFIISGDGGTGGGMFRKMYGEFLMEASLKYEIEGYKPLGKDYIEVAQQWEEVAELLWELGETAERSLLNKIASIVKEIAQREAEILMKLLMIE